MEACIFIISVSAIVNGNATKDFSVERGLRKGDPLSSFLFVLAMEGLTKLMRRTIDVEEFKGVYVNEEVSLDIVQFADDTLILGDDSKKNLGCVKSVLRGFRLVIDLKVNFMEFIERIIR